LVWRGFRSPCRRDVWELEVRTRRDPFYPISRIFSLPLRR
jgi:hypothetical protein